MPCSTWKLGPKADGRRNTGSACNRAHWQTLRGCATIIRPHPSRISCATESARCPPDGRITLSDDKLIETRDGSRQERLLSGDHEWRAKLNEFFGAVLPGSASLYPFASVTARRTSSTSRKFALIFT